MKKILILLPVLLLYIQLFSQSNKIDTAEILYTAKFQVLESEGFLFKDIKELESYLEKRFSARFLKSKGFSDTKFILIEKRKEYDTAFLEKRKDDFKNNNVFFSCDYIVAFVPSTTLFYRLKGFRKNDFPELLNYLDKENSYLLLDDLKSSLIIGTAYVEDLDLVCLNEYYIKKKKNKKIKKEYPCLKSCEERDGKIAY